VLSAIFFRDIDPSSNAARTFSCMIFEAASRCRFTAPSLLPLMLVGAREPEVLGPPGGRGGREDEGATLPMGTEGGKLGVFRGAFVDSRLASLAASVSVALRAAVLTTVGAAHREGTWLAAFEAAPVA
jgi:hypothetical protein